MKCIRGGNLEGCSFFIMICVIIMAFFELGGF